MPICSGACRPQYSQSAYSDGRLARSLLTNRAGALRSESYNVGMRAWLVILIAIIGATWSCGRIGFDQAPVGDGGTAIDSSANVSDGRSVDGQPAGDAGGPVADASGPVVDSSSGGADASLPPIGVCAEWSNWKCIDGGNNCYATCGQYVADCTVDSCTCETPLGEQPCTPRGGECGSCRALVLEGCCGPLTGSP